MLTPEDLVHTDSLLKSFGFSISAVEIAQRGVAAEPGKTLLDTIPQSSLTHLRILAETALSYASVGGLHSNNGNKTVQEFRDMQRRKLCQLFKGHPGMAGLPGPGNIDPLFSQDIFVFLAECSLGLVPVMDIDIHHIIRLCYIAEILKSVFTFMLESDALVGVLGGLDADHDIYDGITDYQDAATRRLFNWIVATYRSSATQHGSLDGSLMNTESPPDRVLKSFRHIAAKYALPFLRKVAILLHAQYGVEFPNTGPDSGELPEIDRLVTLLRLPSVDEVLESFGTGREGSHVEALAAGWIHHWNRLRIGARADDSRNLVPSLSHPAIFELVGLPKFYDVLLDEANQRRCPSTGKELTDPSVCLFCGEIFCSQATCCATNSQKGGCNNHVAKYVFSF
jgi:E3 ubiquitin-protein ligase UBR1